MTITPIFIESGDRTSLDAYQPDIFTALYKLSEFRLQTARTVVASARTMNQIWFDGKLVAEAQATIPVGTHALHYGTAVFDGGKFYSQSDGTFAIFRAQDHIRRFTLGCKSAFIDLPYTESDLLRATCDVVQSQTEPGYVRQIAFPGHGKMGVGAMNPVRVAILAWTPEKKSPESLRVRFAALRGAILPGTKLAGQYSRVYFSVCEARAAGFSETFFLDDRGCVSEASAAAVFRVQGNAIQTPPLYEPILPSITRDTVIGLCQELQIVVHEQPIRADQMFSADEVFVASSAGEIRSVSQVEGRTLPEDNPITQRIAREYERITSGLVPAFSSWLTRVEDFRSRT